MSGKLFQLDEQPAEKISASIAPGVQDMIMDDILAVYPDITLIGLGSVGKKPDDEFNGDIDIGVTADSIEQLEEMMRNVFGDYAIVSSKTFYIVSCKYPYIYKEEPVKYVAVDFILVKDIDYTLFRYYCPDYRKKESKYKVGAKIMFASTILNHCNTVDEGMPEGYHGQYDFSPVGLYKYTINNTNIRDYKKELVTLDVDTIVRIAFKTRGREVFNSVETLWEGIHSDDFKFPEKVKAIEANFFVASYRKCWEEQVKCEDFKLDHWTVDEINELLKRHSYYRRLNASLDSLRRK